MIWECFWSIVPDFGLELHYKTAQSNVRWFFSSLYIVSSGQQWSSTYTFIQSIPLSSTDLNFHYRVPSNQRAKSICLKARWNIRLLRPQFKKVVWRNLLHPSRIFQHNSRLFKTCCLSFNGAIERQGIL